MQPAAAAAGVSRTRVSSGQSLASQRIVIADPDRLTCCLPGEVGEIWVHGPSVAQGYWGRREATDSTFKAYLADTGEGPFLRTGDLGLLAGGELFVTGRIKDVIIVDGRNHYAEDIERTLEHSHPGVRSHGCAAIGVQVHGEERLVVLVEVDRGFASAYKDDAPGPSAVPDGSPDNHGAVIRAVRRAVAEHHDLGIAEVLLLKPGSIPLTSSGKIQRHACRSALLEGTLKTLRGTSNE
jgi:acyl-CoA synthetase (AMP-forming)/AMP-acid ligase II